MATVLQSDFSNDPLALWNGEVPEASQIGLLQLATAACERAFVMCHDEYPLYSDQDLVVPIGWHRFVQLQYRLLEYGKTDAALKSKPLHHDNKLPFTRLFTDRLYLTSITLDAEDAFPQLRLFRREEQAEQTAFFKGTSPLICHLAIGGFEADIRKPKFVHIKFPDGNDGYLDPFVDLKAKAMSAVILPVEKVKDTRNTPPRQHSSEDTGGDELA